MTVQKDLKERLIDDIEKLPAHTKLPSRTELSAQYYVSRQTMDVVINTLCREGYLYALRGAGTYVADPAANIVMGGGLTRRTIGLVLPTYGINISPQLEKGAVEEAARHGLNVVCCVTDHNDRKQMSHLRRLVNSNCAGVLTMAPDGSDGRDMAALLHAARVPVVWLLSKPKSEYDAPVIQYNDISVSTLSVQHLCNQGYRLCVQSHQRAARHAQYGAGGGAANAEFVHRSGLDAANARNGRDLYRAGGAHAVPSQPPRCADLF